MQRLTASPSCLWHPRSPTGCMSICLCEFVGMVVIGIRETNWVSRFLCEFWKGGGADEAACIS